MSRQTVGAAVILWSLSVLAVLVVGVATISLVALAFGAGAMYTALFVYYITINQSKEQDFPRVEV
jgi:uncharacterized membrane protein YuzA (DUF378 family)